MAHCCRSRISRDRIVGCAIAAIFSSRQAHRRLRPRLGSVGFGRLRHGAPDVRRGYHAGRSLLDAWAIVLDLPCWNRPAGSGPESRPQALRESHRHTSGNHVPALRSVYPSAKRPGEPQAAFFGSSWLRDLSFGGGAWALAGVRVGTIGRFWIAIAAIFFGAVYPLHPDIPHREFPFLKLTPTWVPLRLLWGYLNGGLLLGGRNRGPRQSVRPARRHMPRDVGDLECPPDLHSPHGARSNGRSNELRFRYPPFRRNYLLARANQPARRLNTKRWCVAVKPESKAAEVKTVNTLAVKPKLGEKE